MSYPVFEGPKSHIVKLVGTSCESCGIHWEQFWAFGGIIMHHEVWTLLVAQALQGYYLNDLSLLILDDAGEVVASVLGGARRDVSCSAVMEEGREYVAVPVSFRASRGPFVLRIYAAAPVEVLQEPASPKLAWRAMHRLLMSPAPKTQTPFQRMAYDFGVGEVVVVEAASMALGLAVNQNPSASLSLRFVAAGNHTVLRTQGGMQDGCSDEERNQRQKQAESEAKSRGKAGVILDHLLGGCEC